MKLIVDATCAPADSSYAQIIALPDEDSAVPEKIIVPPAAFNFELSGADNEAKVLAL